MQRASVLAELPGLLAERGVAAETVFATSGIAFEALTADTRVPFPALLGCLEKAAEVTGCPHLGLLLGQRFTMAHHGVLGRLMRTAATLHRALLDFTFWQPGYSSGAIVYLHPLGEDYALGYGAAGNGSPVFYDAILAVGLRMLHDLTGGSVLPEEVHIHRRQPEDRTRYAQILKVPVRFTQQRFCLVLSARSLEMPLPAADHSEHQRIQAQLRVMAQTARPGFATRTQQALRHAMQRGTPSMAAVAAELALHPRTLRRRLAEEQTSFEALCDTLRYAAAREYLEMTDLPMSEISAALAYASPGIFAEAFRRWSGLSPTAWRRQSEHGA
jgi:AraC-like DNA-binding protein